MGGRRGRIGGLLGAQGGAGEDTQPSGSMRHGCATTTVGPVSGGPVGHGEHRAALLRAVVEHPDLELVGVYVYSEAKAGRDAGDLCGVAPTGVVATRDVEAVLASKPDCVLYMADRVDTDVLCRLLESGANVVTTRSEFHRPASMDSGRPGAD